MTYCKQALAIAQLAVAMTERGGVDSYSEIVLSALNLLDTVERELKHDPEANSHPD